MISIECTKIADTIPSIYCKRNVSQLVSIVALCLCYSMTAWMDGYTSPTEKEFLQSGLFSPFTFSLFSGLTLFGISSLIIGPITPKLGSKCILIISGILGGLGWFLIILSHDVYSMIIGRILSSSQVGICMTIANIHMSEICVEENRKFLSALVVAQAKWGLCLIYFLGIFLNAQWLAVVALISVFSYTILLLWTPQSPNWLLRQGYERKARSTLIEINGVDFDVNTEIDELKLELNTDNSSGNNGISQLRQRWNTFRPILIASTLQTFMGFGGQGVFFSYAASLFSKTGFNPRVSALPYTISLALGSSMSALLAKRMKRKYLLILATAIQALSNLSIAIFFLTTEHVNAHHSTSSTILLSVWQILNTATFGFSYSLGWGTIAWSMYSDSFDPKYKQISAGIVNLWYTLVLGVIIAVYPNFIIIFGEFIFFLLLTIDCILGLVFEYFFF